MKKITLIFAMIIVTLSVKSQGAKYYLTDAAGQPWGSNSNIADMTTAFGPVGVGWFQATCQGVNVNALFQPSVCLIYIDGGSTNANALNNFVTTNSVALNTWVLNGGRLFCNVAANQGGNINFGFGGCTYNYTVGPYSQPGAAVNNAHPIFVGPAAISSFTHQDNYFDHGYITGPGLTPIINNTFTPWQGAAPVPGFMILGAKPWGGGMAMFGSMTNTSFHSPAPSAGNLRANMLTWLAVCCQQPTITVASTSTVLCSGASATLTAAGAGGGGTYTWTAPGLTITSGTCVITPTGSGIYTASGTNSTGCVGSKTIQIIVNPTPSLTATNNGPICQGANINLVTPAVPGGTSVAYSWMGPGSYTSGIQNPVIANAQPTNSGVYTLTAINSFTTGTSCQSSTTTSVAVIPVNQVSVTPFFTLCQGSNLNLTAANAVPPTSYSWAGPAAFTSTLQNPIIPNALPPIAGDYSVLATFAVPGLTFVCTSTAVTNVSVVATSPVTVSLPNNICQDATALLTASANPLPLSYDWTGPNGFVAAGSNTSIPNILPSSTGLYQVVATWAIGTKSCTITGFNQINVVNVNPIAINAPVTVCYPSNVSLTSSSQGAISYFWTGPNSFTSGIASPLLASPQPSASGLYSLTAAYTNGALVCYNSNTTNVTVNPILPFNLVPYRQVCFNSVYSMTGPGGATTYTWIGPGGFTSNTQVLSIPSIQSPQSGDYTLTVNLGPCTTSATTKVDVLSPIAFTQTPGNTVICRGDSVKLIMGSSGGSRNYAYVWNPQMYLGSPTGSVQYGKPDNTTIYNVYGYDITCPNYSVTTSFTVTVNRAPEPDLKLDAIEGCQPLCLTYNSRTQNEAVSITYDFGNGSILQADSFAYCLDNPGSYNLKINTKGKNGCSAVYSHPAPIVVWPTPHSDMNWTPDQPTSTNNHVTFEPTSQYGPITKYSWSFQAANGISGYDTSALRNPTRVYENVGKYPVMLVSTTDKGCIDTVFKVLEVRDEFALYLPNTFTPNGDGLNDIFNVKGIGLKTEGFSMEIYDRWGTLIYSTKDVMKGWDGTVKGIFADNGVYVYKIKAVGANGEGKKEFVGHVSILK